MARLDKDGITTTGMSSVEKVLTQSVGAEIRRLSEELSALRRKARAELESSDTLKAPSHCAERQEPSAECILAAIGRLVAKIRGLEAALEKIGRGEYGLCEDCGEDIPLRRLEANGLETRLCTSCQDEQEEANKRGQTKPDRGSIALSPPLRR